MARRPARTKDGGLTPFNERFIDEYLVDYVGVRAYFRAGFKGTTKSAYTSSSRLLARPDIQKALNDRRKQIADRAEVTQANVLKEYARIAFSNIGRALTRDPKTGRVTGIDVSKLTEDDLAAVANLNFEGGKKSKTVSRLKMHDKKGALDKLGVHLRLFKDDEAPAFTTVNFIVERTRERKPPAPPKHHSED